MNYDDYKKLVDAPDDTAFELDGQTISKQQVLQQIDDEKRAVKNSVVKQRDDWVSYRASLGVEEQWQKSSDLYYGKDTPDTSFIETLKVGPAPQKSRDGAEAPRSRVVVNIVRPKVDQAVARMCEILLPTDDKNWGIRPTPIPEKVKGMLGDHRQTVIPGTNQVTPAGKTAHQEAEDFISEARKKAAAMEKAIDDQLTECKYNGEQRAMIADGVRLGAGVLIGPFPSSQVSKAWMPQNDGTQAMVIEKKTVPASMRADPWDVWFDPAAGNNHQNGAGFWHKRMVTRKQIRGLVGLPGFDEKALRTVLQERPSRVTTTAKGRVQRSWVSNSEAYEMWTYHGEVEPDHCNIMSWGTGDPLEDVDFGVIVLINSEVVGVMPSWIEDKSLPVDVWNWREADEHPYGHSLPEELEHQQRVVTAAWRQVMDNARFSVGSQVVFLDGVTPANGRREITPGKLWHANPEKVDDARKAMAAVDFPSHLEELLAIVDKAMQFADSESSMPQLLGGQQGGVPETVGGMVMFQNNAQGVLRLRVKLYDDNITNPHISRYYDWNMAKNPDPNIKGDMEVDARGTSALLEKDIQNQATLNLANVLSNPKFGAYIDPRKELEAYLRAFKFQPETFFADEEQIKKNLSAPPPADPRIESAKMALEGKQLDIQDRQQQRQVDQQEHAADRADRAADRNYNMQREQGEYAIAMTGEQNDRDLQFAKLASNERTTAAQLEANLGIKHLEIDNDRQLFNAEAALRVQTGAGI
jgi:hypothetical protein